MTDSVVMPPVGRWSSWAGYAASGSAAVYGAVLLARAMTGRGSVVGVPHLALPAAVILLAGAVPAVATAGLGRRMLPARAVSAGVWVVGALALAGSCFVLLNLIELVLTGTVRDRDGDSDWSGFIERMCFAVVGALFVASALSWRHRTSSVSTRCGHAHGRQVAGLERPAPHAAPRSVRRIAYAGCVAFVPYLALHALGILGDFSVVKEHYTDGPPPWYALLGLLLGVGLADLLLLGLVRPWGMAFPRWTPWLAGRRVPRFLPLAPVWMIAPTLVLYGTGSMILAILLGTGIVGGEPHVPLLGGAASLAFGGYGWALAIAAVSYRFRTRPRCASLPSGSTPSHRAAFRPMTSSTQPLLSKVRQVSTREDDPAMALSTAFTELMGVRHPIALAPMGGLAGAALAAAVSRSGGLGMLGAGGGDREWLERELPPMAEATDQPWGIGFLTWAIEVGAVEHALEYGPRAVMLSFGDPGPYVDRIRQAGAALIIQVTDVQEAERAIDLGADIVVAQGTEAGGHGARRGRSTLAFVPVVADLAGPVPVLAAGGIADGRGIAAALALGASGALIGTRFQVTVEARADPAVTKAIIEGSGQDTERSSVLDILRGSQWSSKYTARTLGHPHLDRWRDREAELAAHPQARRDYHDDVARGAIPPRPIWAGEAIDLITDLPSAGDLVATLVTQTESALARAGTPYTRPSQ